MCACVLTVAGAPVPAAIAIPSASNAAAASAIPSASNAAAASTIPSASNAAAASAATGADSPGDSHSLSQAQVAAQIAQADRLRADLMRASTVLSTATRQLTALAERSDELLGTLADARAAGVAATAKATEEQTRLGSLTKDVAAAQDDLGRWAHDTYIQGSGPLEGLAAMVQVLTSRSPADSADSLGLLQYLADQRSHSFDHLVDLTTAQRKATDAAATARDEADQAAAVAAQTKTSLDIAVREQQAALEVFRIAEGGQIARANTLRGRLLGSRDTGALAADRRLAEALAGAGAGVGLVTVTGTCRADNGVYPNGRLPASALCPVHGAPGEYLRQAPAAAFNALSRAYQRDTGSPLCVTDAYRPYAEQVAVAKAKPALAATPGTSKHGLGIAVDLCGGVRRLGSAAHLWMKQHAPLYGWFHPAWAEPGGSMPEPWHWEFAG